ncbi:flagellar biosynthetic protein FliR [Nitratiruptor tergarcus]|uniref:Flagellar biosynthetic protein FliR n=1 Tax=Nitratiruptor tergarcus DSM 16512 TaxID=1069081 RepID=A0A1W1WTC2_9BACT|nr:flagellar biosynthetic protein FliR [Nitratiruptor tergarcus]SMC09300.1 flagellar biosynthetic protein FliR [Nitratiruptor tergarcus DSM 16512]
MTPLVTVHDAIAISLVFTRIIALFLSFPFFNTTMIPTNVKILLVVSLSFFIVKNISFTFSLEDITLYKILLMILLELLIGFGIGLLVNFFVSAFSYAAEIISYFMGLTVVNMFDPTYGQISVLSKLFLMLFYIIFFASGAYGYFVSALFMSFSYIPLGMMHIQGGFWQYIIQNSFTIFVLAFKLAFPFALILYLVNLALALVNRLIPQINVFIVGLPLQIFIGLAALALGASVIVFAGEQYLKDLIHDIIYLIKSLGK